MSQELGREGGVRGGERAIEELGADGPGCGQEQNAGEFFSVCF